VNTSALKKIAAKNARIAILEDLGSGDITTKTLGKAKYKIKKAVIKSNENGILCGQYWFDNCFKHVQKKYGGTLKIIWAKKDKEKIKKGQKICEVIAPLQTILIAERSSLNFIQVLSGISTKTSSYINKLNNNKIKILDTRKTIPGIRAAQKYAVLCGGGNNHRLGLYDQILIKENHITENINNMNIFLENINKKINFKKISIEVETLKELKLVQNYNPKNILLDNFKITQIKKACKMIDRNKTTIEISGNINIKNINKYAKLDIDYISIGDLTKNIDSLDFSMLVKKV